MNIPKLNRIIAKFRENEGSDIYALGTCSEFAVALRKFLKGGTVAKDGLMHTVLQYDGHYCDIYGCKTYTSGEYIHPATPKEMKHINFYLEDGRPGKRDTVNIVLRGLKRAEKEVR